MPAPSLNFAAPHFAAPHEKLAATPKKIAAPGRQKPKISVVGIICKNRLEIRVEKGGGGKKKTYGVGAAILQLSSKDKIWALFIL